MMGCGIDGPDAMAAVCRFKATDKDKLSAWTFDGYLFSTNETLLGSKVDFFEVRISFPSPTSVANASIF